MLHSFDGRRPRNRVIQFAIKLALPGCPDTVTQNTSGLKSGPSELGFHRFFEDWILKIAIGESVLLVDSNTVNLARKINRHQLFQEEFFNHIGQI